MQYWNLNLEKWIYEKDMTEEQKKENPLYKINNWFLQIERQFIFSNLNICNTEQRNGLLNLEIEKV